MRNLLAPFLGSAALAGVLTVACGAENLDAPPVVKNEAIHQCRGFAEAMPNFVTAISTGRTQNLKTVIETHLLKPLREGDAPPINDVLRSIFVTLTRLAQKPAELGAPAGQYCVPTAPEGTVQQPALQRANELCEMRRSLEVLVHRGRADGGAPVGIDAIRLFEPQLNTLLGYISGKGRGADVVNGVTTPHWEIAGIVSTLCAQDGKCQLSNGLDLVIAFTDYSNTSDGKLMVEHLNALVSTDAGTASIMSFLDPSSLSEDGMVAIAKTLVPAILGADATGLQQAFDSLPLSTGADGGSNLRRDLQPLVDDMKKILGRPELIGPIRRGLNCIWGSPTSQGRWSGKDGNFDLVRMVYRLALRDKLPEYGLTRLVGVVQGLQQVDSRGSLVFLAGTLAAAVRSDEQAIDSTASVCRTLFSTATYPGQVRSNAELATPVVAELVAAGILEEAICAVDTLLFGCAGGTQPACVAH